VISSLTEREVDARRTSTIYLDFNATTPVDPLALAAMLPYFSELPGNPASSHAPGAKAAEAVERARDRLAAASDANPAGIVFTSGATEADNLAIAGLWAARSSLPRRRIITVATEHKAVLARVDRLSAVGADVIVLGVDAFGRVRPDELVAALETPTLLLSIAAANNETGVIADLANLVPIAHAAGALVHSDAAQVLGKMPFRIRALDLDLVSLSAHKAYGPKGVGALYIRPGIRVSPLLLGGDQEGGMRSGTLNVPSIVGFGAAAEMVVARMSSEISRLADMRDALWRLLEEAIPGVIRNTPELNVLPNTLNIRLPGLDAEDVLLASPGVAAATGSACSSGSPEPSHVLRAMGLPYEEAQASVRLSLGHSTSKDDLHKAVTELAGAVDRLRGLG
jgi:cysteine desulfurase